MCWGQGSIVTQTVDTRGDLGVRASRVAGRAGSPRAASGRAGDVLDPAAMLEHGGQEEGVPLGIAAEQADGDRVSGG